MPLLQKLVKLFVSFFFPAVLNNPLSRMSVNLSSFTLSRSVWTRLMRLVLTKGLLPLDIEHEHCLEEEN